MENKQKVAILGASPDASRYSYKAFHLLKEYGHQVYLVAPQYQEIEGEKVVPQLGYLTDPIDTLTVYVRPAIFKTLINQVKDLAPKRVIFNPGTEDKEIIFELEKAGITCESACTLVLLSTGQF